MTPLSIALTTAQKRRFAHMLERDRCLLVESELRAKYNTPILTGEVENQLGRPFEELVPNHNPLWYYALQVWYDEDYWAQTLQVDKHRDIMCNLMVDYALGNVKPNDGLWFFWPRTVYKSTFLMVYVDWLGKRQLLVDKLYIPFYYFHRVEEEAVTRTRTVRGKQVEHPYIAKTFPEFVMPSGSQTDRSFDWAAKPAGLSGSGFSLNARGIMGSKAGKHGLVFFDDIETELCYDSPRERKSLYTHYLQARKLRSLRMPFEVGVDTFYHPHALCWTIKQARVTPDDPNSPKRYLTSTIGAHADDNSLNFPQTGLTEEYLERERLNEISLRGTDSHYYLQYELDPHLTGIQGFEWSWLHPLPWEEFVRICFDNTEKRIVQLVDSAWKGQQNQLEGDDTVIATVMIRSHGMRQEIIIMDLIVSNELISDEGAELICANVKKWNSPYVFPEMQGEKTFYGTLRSVARNVGVSPIVVGEDIGDKSVKFTRQAKAARIAALSGRARTGLISYVLPPKDGSPGGCRNIDKLEYQVRNWPQLEHEDVLDSLALVCDPILQNILPQPMFNRMDVEDPEPPRRRSFSRYCG